MYLCRTASTSRLHPNTKSEASRFHLEPSRQAQFQHAHSPKKTFRTLTVQVNPLKKTKSQRHALPTLFSLHGKPAHHAAAQKKTPREQRAKRKPLAILAVHCPLSQREESKISACTSSPQAAADCCSQNFLQPKLTEVNASEQT